MSQRNSPVAPVVCRRAILIGKKVASPAASRHYKPIAAHSYILVSKHNPDTNKATRERSLPAWHPSSAQCTSRPHRTSRVTSARCPSRHKSHSTTPTPNGLRVRRRNNSTDWRTSPHPLPTRYSTASPSNHLSAIPRQDSNHPVSHLTSNTRSCRGEHKSTQHPHPPIDHSTRRHKSIKLESS